ncbi:Ribophorin I [Ochromonadaceae sp. CCMP2298]|nr:Ribophorin I [Ochromonadaceae sp. CCMP2298]
MLATMRVAATLLAVLLAALTATGAVVNKDVTRVVDASTSVVRVSATIKAENIENEYQIIFSNSMAEHLSILSVTAKGQPLVVRAPVMTADYTIYSVETTEASATLKMAAVFTNVLEAYPAEITQRENQFMRLADSHYFYSPYATESQKTTFKLASSTIESFTKLAPFATKGSNLQFGPYEAVPPFSVSPAVIHYQNNFPFAKFTTMNRELEVSHWGSIAFEEVYELLHTGATLKGGFSRIEYQMPRQGAQPSFRSLATTLPAQSSNVYYRDQIGNISTSDMKVADDGTLELDIMTRFPLFGGWKTQFYLGYSVPTESALYLDSAGRYNLKVDFFTAFQDVWVEDMELKVVLPEGCEDIKVTVPYAVEQATARRFTYLDSEMNGGRPVIILNAKNLVEEHDKQVHISYTFNKPRMFVEPIMLVLSYFFFFCFCSLVGRMGVGSAVKKATPSA